MKLLIAGALLIVAIIHLLPVIGLLGNAQLERLYGVAIADPNLSILMRHRAALFGLIGGFIAVGAFHPPIQWTAVVFGLVNVLAFIALASQTGGYNALVARVVWVDWIALGLLAFVCVGLVLTSSK
jgi:hypothetical protein